MAKAAYGAVFEASKYGQIGSNADWSSSYDAYRKVGNIYNKFIPKTPADKDSLLFGDARI